MKKGALQISFGWLFAIIVGAVVLFLAIYMATKIMKSEQTVLNTETAKRLGVLTNPLETGFETGSRNIIELPSETRIYNTCSASNNKFGKQIISVSQKALGKWPDKGVEVSFENKYLFSENILEGKTFYLFSKKFNYPFKVTDLIIIIPTSKKYCFIDADEEIKNEFAHLELDNVLFENCSGKETRVCFSDRDNCDVKVNLYQKYVQKENKEMYFIGDSLDFTDNALMYSAIFSSPEVYECQLKRLMKRIDKLSELYVLKAGIISQKGCNTNLISELAQLSNSAINLESSRDILLINQIVKTTQEKNEDQTCRLW